MTPPAIPPGTTADQLRLAIERGDAEGVKNLCLALSPQQRGACAALVAELGQHIKFSVWPAAYNPGQWGAPAGPEHHRAHDLATLACGDPEDMFTLVEHIGVRWEEAADFQRALGREPLTWRRALQQIASKRLTQHAQAIEPVQRLVAGGLIDRPSGPDYTTALIAWPRIIHWQSPGGMAARLRADPGAFQAFLDFFEVQGSAEHNLAAMEKYAKPSQTRWPQIFLQGIAEGHYTRSQMLDRTLAALESDWPQMRAGWFSRFHQLLAPSATEMAAFSERYLGLTHSRIPPTVALALEALRTLQQAQAVSAAALLPALAPVFYATAKAQVVAALKLLQSVCAENPTVQAQASGILLPGLLHPAADVQGAVLKTLSRWGLDDPQRDALKAYSNGIAQCHLAIYSALVGGATPPRLTQQDPTSSAAVRVAPNNPLSNTQGLRSVMLDAEGVERIAAVLEKPGDIDELECAIAALVRLAPLPPDQRQRCAPLLKRARKLKPGSLSFELARLLIFVVQGERLPSGERRRPHEYPEPAVLAPRVCFAGRIDDLIDQAAQGLGLDPLSTPSHRGGFLDTAVLEARLAAHRALGYTTSEAESALARQRTLQHPVDQARFKWNAGVRTVDYDGQSFRFTVFEVAHAGVQLIEPPLERLGLAELRYAASTMPGQLESFFAAGCLALANNIDWWEARWCNRVFIEPLLEPITPITAEFPMAVLALALALGGKQPGQTAMAVDALTLAHGQGRLEAGALASTLQALFATPLPKAKRYAASFGSALHNDPAIVGTVFTCLCGIVRADAIRPIKDLGALLDLLLEAGLAGELTLPADLGQLLRSGRGSPALVRKQKALLAHLG